MKRYKRDAFEQEKSELIESLTLELKWLIPIQLIVFAVVFYFAVDFFDQPLSASDIIGVAVVLCLQNLVLPIYRLWRINKRLATSKSNAKQPRFLN